MGSAELDIHQLIIYSHIITYGSGADPAITENTREEIENISFVDGLGCNSGYFILQNLFKGSTTAAALIFFRK